VAAEEAVARAAERADSKAAYDALHFRHEFEEGSCKLYCRALFACEFQRLRDSVFKESSPDFASSLAECRDWVTSGGKSGSAFYITRDDR